VTLPVDGFEIEDSRFKIEGPARADVARMSIAKGLLRIKFAHFRERSLEKHFAESEVSGRLKHF
jgi:hypothetical protein